MLSMLLSNCKEDNYNLDKKENNTSKKGGNSLLEMSYDITTYLDYDVNRENLSNIDLATINPSSEKQNVTIEFMENGAVNMTIKDVSFDKKIVIPHKTLPNTSPKIVKTEIFGNTANYYDSNNKLISSVNVEIPLQTDLVERIHKLGENFTVEELNDPITTLQGVNFIKNLDDFIAQADSNVIVSNQGEEMITIRVNLSYLNPKNTGSSVLLIDKVNKRLLATRIYSDINELLQTTFYGYNKDTKNLDAIKTIQAFRLPSGNVIKSISTSKIEKLTFKINI